MDRREFAALFGAGVLFPASFTEAAIEPPDRHEFETDGYSDAGMADEILHHPLRVRLLGDGSCFGQYRDYHYTCASSFVEQKDVLTKIGEWTPTSLDIANNYVQPRWMTTKTVGGCIVQIRDYGRYKNELFRIDGETWFDISNPKLKVIRFAELGDVVARHFVRIGGCWRQL